MDRTTLSIGVVVKPHGFKGLLKIRPYRETSDVLQEGRSIWLVLDGQWTKHQLRSVRRDRQWFLVEIDGCVTRQAAESWRGAKVAIPRENLPALQADEVYLADCIGLDAVTLAGRPLGRIEGLVETGGHDLFEIQDGQEELLVPACAPFLVDVTDDTVVLDKVEDLPRHKKPRKKR